MGKLKMKASLSARVSKVMIPFSLLLCTPLAHATPIGADLTEIEVLKETPIVQQSKQKESTIKGVVFDALTKEPVIGASVTCKNKSGIPSGQGTITNIDGEFSLSCKVDDVLSVSFIGYETKNVTVSNLKIYTIELSESTAQLGEVVVTAFGTGQKKASMVGSVDQIKPAELKVPSSSLSSSFAGRMAGVIAVQRSGEPGADGANFWIRGKSTFSGSTNPLIVLDGVEISSGQLNRLDPEVIESFSILKDATATALYGTRGANGVMIVTSKSGQDLDKPIINIRVEASANQMGDTPQMVGGVDYMNLYNEAASRPGESGTPYSQDRIQGTIAGKNPYLYPNVDWYDELFKKNSFSERLNFNIRGGSKRADYFMSASVRNDGGNMKSISKDYFSYNNNIKRLNYEFVNNLNIKVTSTTKISLGLNLSVIDWSGPSMSANDVFALTRRVNPVDFPVTFPGGTSDFGGILWGDKGPNDAGYGNPVAEYVKGYKESLSSTITANFRVEQKLDKILKGLKVSGLFSFKNHTNSSTTRKSDYNKFEIASYDQEASEYALKRVGTEKTTQLSTSGEHSGDQGKRI